MGSISKAVGGIFGGGGGERAAREAADIQARAQEQSVGEQRRQFNITRQQLDPFRQAGLSALNLQLALMGLPQIGGQATPASSLASGGFTQPVQNARNIPNRLIRVLGGQGGGGGFAGIAGRFVDALTPAQALTGGGTAAASIPQFTREQALESLTQLPGQEFIRNRQEQALLRNAAALGGLGGGQVRTDLQQQATGFAQQDLQNQLQRLAALSGSGQQAAAQLGGFGAQTAGNITNALTGAAQARASGILGAQQAGAQQAQQGLNLIGSIAAPFLLSDERYKEDVQELNLKACYLAVMETPLKAWRYINGAGFDESLHIGPMAQDAPEMIRVEDMDGTQLLNLHDELMLIAGALQYMKNEGLLTCH